MPRVNLPFNRVLDGSTAICVTARHHHQHMIAKAFDGVVADDVSRALRFCSRPAGTLTMKALVLRGYGGPDALELRDLILDVKTNRSPFAYARALRPKGTYATVGGDIPRLLRTAILGPLISRVSRKHVRVVGLKPNKDLAYMNQLFEAGQIAPVIDSQYDLADVPDAFRRFGAADHKGKIVIGIG